jgi:4-hydroxy-4-methyl-2-oxoglutarate aldolase
MNAHALPARSSLVSDALDELGLPARQLVPAPAPLRAGWSAAGRALPALIAPAPSGSGRAVGYLDLFDALKPGDVVVLGLTPDVPRSAVWGELLGGAAHVAGAAAVVTPGYVRDAEPLAAAALPVFAGGTCERRPDGRVDVVAIAQPVTIGDAVIRHGDCIVADRDGIVAIARDDAAAVAQATLHRGATERRIAAALAAGLSLREALRRSAGIS